jgi:parallel beta-helix repeat protein
LIQDNLIEGNGQNGIVIVGNSVTTVTQNIVRDNRDDGIEATLDSHAEIRGNVVERNRVSGIAVTAGSTGIIAQNMVRENDRGGLRIVVDADAEVIDNAIVNNQRCGIKVALRSTAVIRGGRITQTRVDPTVTDMEQGSGMCLDGTDRRGLFNGPASATVGFGSGAVIEITGNEGAGIFVLDDGSEATIDSRNIIFRNNAAGDTVGNVIDVAP